MNLFLWHPTIIVSCFCNASPLASICGVVMGNYACFKLHWCLSGLPSLFCIFHLRTHFRDPKDPRSKGRKHGKTLKNSSPLRSNFQNEARKNLYCYTATFVVSLLHSLALLHCYTAEFLMTSRFLRGGKAAGISTHRGTSPFECPLAT